MRNLHLVGLTEKELKTLHNARLVAAALLVVLFTGLVAVAPEAPDTASPVAVNEATD